MNLTEILQTVVNASIVTGALYTVLRMIGLFSLSDIKNFILSQEFKWSSATSFNTDRMWFDSRISYVQNCLQKLRTTQIVGGDNFEKRLATDKNCFGFEIIDVIYTIVTTADDLPLEGCPKIHMLGVGCIRTGRNRLKKITTYAGVSVVAMMIPEKREHYATVEGLGDYENSLIDNIMKGFLNMFPDDSSSKILILPDVKNVKTLLNASKNLPTSDVVDFQKMIENRSFQEALHLSGLFSVKISLQLR